MAGHLDIEGDVVGVADDDDVEVEHLPGHRGAPGGRLPSPQPGNTSQNFDEKLPLNSVSLT